MIDFNLTIVIQFLNLLILMILLNFLLFKPVLKAMEKREGAIGSRLDNVHTIEEAVNTLKKNYEEGIKEGRRPIIEAKDAAVTKARASATQMIEKARTDLTEEISKIRIDMENDSKTARQTLMADVEKMSGEVAQKLLIRSVS